jgi:serine/threonine protein kinase
MSEVNAGPRVLGDRYELGPLLGRGGMADVFRAEDRTLQRPVAVKVLREVAGDEPDRARFVSEARTLAGLSHSGLVTVLDAGFGLGDGGSVDANAHPFLVMELVDGRTIGQVVQDSGALPLEDVGSVGAQVAEALAYVHRNGVVHRDVKPGNILLGPRHRVRLADFGVARLVADSSGHTRTGHVIGTAAYLAPEQVTGDEVSGATDVYSLGLVLLEALTGRREFPGAATEAAVARLHRDPEVPESLPEEWRDLLARMLAREPARRPSADTVAERLRAYSPGNVPQTAESTPDAVTTPLLARPDPLPAAPDVPADGASRTSTRVMPEPGASLPEAGEEKPVHDRLGDALARNVGRQATSLWGAAKGSSETQRGIAAVVAALVLFLVVVAVAGGTSSGGDDLPDNTPSELVEPLQDLHDAVEGTD